MSEPSPITQALLANCADPRTLALLLDRVGYRLQVINSPLSFDDAQTWALFQHSDSADYAAAVARWATAPRALRRIEAAERRTLVRTELTANPALPADVRERCVRWALQSRNTRPLDKVVADTEAAELTDLICTVHDFADWIMANPARCQSVAHNLIRQPDAWATALQRLAARSDPALAVAVLRADPGTIRPVQPRIATEDLAQVFAVLARSASEEQLRSAAMAALGHHLGACRAGDLATLAAVPTAPFRCAWIAALHAEDQPPPTLTSLLDGLPANQHNDICAALGATGVTLEHHNAARLDLSDLSTFCQQGGRLSPRAARDAEARGRFTGTVRAPQHGMALVGMWSQLRPSARRRLLANAATRNALKGPRCAVRLAHLEELHLTGCPTHLIVSYLIDNSRYTELDFTGTALGNALAAEAPLGWLTGGSPSLSISQWNTVCRRLIAAVTEPRTAGGELDWTAATEKVLACATDDASRHALWTAAATHPHDGPQSALTLWITQCARLADLPIDSPHLHHALHGLRAETATLIGALRSLGSRGEPALQKLANWANYGSSFGHGSTHRITAALLGPLLGTDWLAAAYNPLLAEYAVTTLREHLGEDQASWATALTLLEDGFNGPLETLIEAARAVLCLPGTSSTGPI